MPDLTIIPSQVRPIGAVENRLRTVIVDQDTQKGQLLYRKPNKRAGLARANAVGTAKVLGIATQDAKAGMPVEALFWGRIAGFDLGDLNAGDAVFLSSATAGALTDTAPGAAGEVVVPIGQVDCYTNPSATPFIFVDISQSAVPEAIPSAG